MIISEAAGLFRRLMQPWPVASRDKCRAGETENQITDILQKPKNGWKNQQITKDGRYGGFGGSWCKDENGKWLRYTDPRVAKERSKTFPGIAKAMADQWG